MAYNFDATEDRRGSDSVKWNKAVIKNICSNEDALPFWVADMDFKTEDHIKERALKEAERSVFGYPMDGGIISIFASWCEKRHDWKIDQNKTLFVSGLLHGIALAIDLFTKEGDKILVPSPTYRPFLELCVDSGRLMVDLPLKRVGDGTFSLDIAEFKKVAKECQMILFCSPQNPSGIVFTENELKSVLEVAKEYDIPLLSDEIHADLVHPSANHMPMGKANEKIGAKIITYLAPSKTFNLAGEHAAFAVFSDDEMLSLFRSRQKALRVTTPGYMIKQLLSAAYSEGYEYIMELTAYLEGTVREMKAYLKENCPEIKLSNADASFVSFLDLSEVYQKIEKKVLSDPQRYPIAPGGGVLSTFFGIESGVCMNDGTWFGKDYKEYVRINYGTSREMVMNALKEIVRAVKAL